MIRFLLLVCCMLGASLWSHASQPIRRLLVRDAAGALTSLSLDSLGLSRPGGPEAKCPYRAPRRDTRAFATTSDDGLGVFGRSARGTLSSIGTPLIPVVMVEFSDVAFAPTTTRDTLNRLFNESGYRQTPNSRGSVRDYFTDQSYGRFQPRFEIAASVKLSRPRAYYGKNAGGSNNLNIHEFYRESIALAQTRGVDFRRYVVGNAVPLVVFLFAGEGEHDSRSRGSEDFIWAHYKADFVQVGGVAFNSYFVGNELMPVYKRENRQVVMQDGYPVVESLVPEGIGVLCHELGHALGLPDFYSTAGDPLDYETPDLFDVMDYGQYWNEGYAPTGYSAYERSCLGWLQPKELTTAHEALTLAPLDALGGEMTQAFLLRNPERAREYYILENRQPRRWFPKRLGSGLLIYHIDYDPTHWDLNTVNTERNHPRCSIVRADGAWQAASKSTSADDYRGDFFPGLRQVTEFSDTSTPKLAWFEGEARRRIGAVRIDDKGMLTFAYDDYAPVGLHRASAAPDTRATTIFTLDGRPANGNIKRGTLVIKAGRLHLAD